MRIKTEAIEMTATLNDTPSAKAIWDALPIEGRGNTWGDEIYFGIPVQTGEEAGAAPEVDEGDLAYWPPGSAFCIFYGMTPASSAGQIRAASAVNKVGRLTGDASVLKGSRSGVSVVIDKK